MESLELQVKLSLGTRCSESLLSLDHGLDTVVHVLDEIDLGAAESAEVGDVKDAIISLGVLTVGTADLDVVLVSDSLELVLLLGELGELDVHGSAHASAEVGGARGNVTKMLVVGELGLLLNLGSSDGEALEDLTDVGARLHGDDAELILLVNPDEESLGVVVEDATGLRPVALETARLEVLVATLEEEVVLDELVLLSLSHAGERVVLALELTVESAEGRDDLGLNVETLLLGDGGTERVVSQVAADTDSSGVDHPVLIRREVGALELTVVHVGDVLVRGRVLVVLGDDLVEKRSESVEALVAAGVHADAGVGPLAAREDALLESVAIWVLPVLASIPDVTGQDLGEERWGARGEVRELGDLGGEDEVAAHHLAVGLDSAVRHLSNEDRACWERSERLATYLVGELLAHFVSVELLCVH